MNQPAPPPIVDLLQQQLAASQQLLAETRQALADARRENTLLRQKLDALARRFFGKQSEQLNEAQLELLLQGLGESRVAVPVPSPAAKASPAPRRPNPQSQRLRTPNNLEVVQVVIEPEVVTAQPQAYKNIGQEVSRLLDYQPGKFFWRETVRPKYVRVDERALPPVMASAPPRVAEHCLAAPGLLAQLLASKYCDHQPFYRLENIYYQRHGVFISRQQMVQWTEPCVRLLRGIAKLLKAQMRTSGYVQVDETPVRYQAPELVGRCGQGYLWTALVPGECVVYEWHASRAAKCLDAFLGEDYSGKLQCDGYSAYPAFAKTKTNIELFGCWAHLRRGFFAAKEQAPVVAGWILNQIGALYGWEEQLRQTRAGPAARQALRTSHHRMVVARLPRVLTRLQSRYLPQSPMGQAIGYALNQWPTMVRFLEHGEVEIDNNKVENAIRPTALGKKNWLFFGSEEAGERSAVMYTLMENCKMHGVEPIAYLKDVLERLPITTNKQVDQLTPLNWKKSRQQVVVAA